jgi:hypothetical protein
VVAAVVAVVNLPSVRPGRLVRRLPETEAEGFEFLGYCKWPFVRNGRTCVDRLAGRRSDRHRWSRDRRRLLLRLFSLLRRPSGRHRRLSGRMCRAVVVVPRSAAGGTFARRMAISRRPERLAVRLRHPSVLVLEPVVAVCGLLLPITLLTGLRLTVRLTSVPRRLTGALSSVMAISRRPERLAVRLRHPSVLVLEPVVVGASATTGLLRGGPPRRRRLLLRLFSLLRRPSGRHRRLSGRILQVAFCPERAHLRRSARRPQVRPASLVTRPTRLDLDPAGRTTTTTTAAAAIVQSAEATIR